MDKVVYSRSVQKISRSLISPYFLTGGKTTKDRKDKKDDTNINNLFEIAKILLRK